MKFIAKISLLGVMLFSMASASAQYYRFGGLMMDHDGMMSNDMYALSQVNFGFGTARSMAMAGAFTSLGGDLSSMGINPAGLAMFRHNEISISPMMGFQNSTNSAQDWGDNQQSRFAISNFSTTFKLYEGSSSNLVSLNVGLGYNRVADFNYRYGYSSLSAPSDSPYRSINDAFVRQLGQGGVFPDNDGALNYAFGDAYYWGGILAYNNWLIDAERDEFGDYWTSANTLGVNASVGHTVGVESKGSIGEYQVALAANFNNTLYVGGTIGIQYVHWDRQFYYGEDYIYNGQQPVYADGTPIAEPAEWLDYNQAVELSGAGVNFKLGAIYRPFPALRLGAAIHTPTYYALDRTYQAYMGSNYNPNGDTTLPLEDMGEQTWDFVSPTRLMFGASYTFGRMAVVSVDYERTWYNGMRVKNIPDGFDLSEEDYRAEFKANYKGANTLRIGAEIKPLSVVSLRAGYGISDAMLRNDKELYYNTPTTYKTTCISAGLGF
ncbi:MAG: hypothetical protein IKA38_02660, partial [Alistipes sp.]|nr:hypothetical protein [Alistipes sp.]